MDDYAYHLYEEARAGRLTRTEVLQRAAVAGLSGSVLARMLTGAPSAFAATARRAVKPKRGGIARLAIQTPTADVDPVTMNNIGANNTAQIAGEYLVYPSPSYVLQPRLATKWRAVKPDVWTFQLRPGVKFHDGSTMTADDVVATFDRLTDPANNSSALSNFKGVLSKGGTQKSGPLSVTFHLDRPFVDFPYLVSAFNYNTIVLPKNYEIGDFLKGGVGTGAYILQQYTPKVGAKYVRNPHYWGAGLPYLDGVQAVYFDGTAPSVLALEANSVDAYLTMPYQGTQALFHDPTVSILRDRSSQHTAVHMRVDVAAFKDRRVRQAVAWALDRRALVKTLFQGNADVGDDHIFAPVFPVASLASRIPQRQENIKLAKQLLAAAGHPRGLQLNLTVGDYLEASAYAVLLKQQLKKTGIDVKLNIEDTAHYYGSGKNQPWLSVPFGMTTWGERGTPGQLAAQAYQCGAVWNSAHWCNAAYNRAIVQVSKELDEHIRRKTAAKAARLQQRDTPVILAYWVGQLRAVKKNLHGLAKGPTSHIDPRSMWLG